MFLALLGNRYIVAGLAVLGTLGTLWLWHVLDKSSAVKTALVKYVAAVELAQVEGELKELKRRKAVTEKANASLRIKAAETEAQADKFEEELKRYAEVNAVNPDCVVDDTFLDSLQ